MNKIKKIKLWLLPVLVLFWLLPVFALAQGLNPLLSTEDLAAGLSNPKLVIVDIRKVEEYKAGHIPGAINVFYNNWAPGRGGLQNEMPPDDDLADLLSSSGIQPDTPVVVYGKTDAMPDRVNVTRVAWALKYAGVQKVSVLSGGFDKWIFEKRAVSAEALKPQAKPYKGVFNKNLLARKAYVQSQIGKAVIVDVREPAFFTGQQKLPFVARSGHIKGAVNLPTLQAFSKQDNCCWTYQDAGKLKAMASGVLGSDLAREIIVYCDSGRVASAWWFILTEVLGYKDVKNYDGSMEEWTKDANAPVEP